MGWASPEGLGNRAKFPRLEKVTIYVRDGLEDATVRKRNTDRCKASIEGLEDATVRKQDTDHCKASIEGPGNRRKGSPTTKTPAGVKAVEVEIIPDKNKVGLSSEFYNAVDGRYVT